MIVHDNYPESDGKSLGHASSNVGGRLYSWGPWPFIEQGKYADSYDYIINDQRYRSSEGFLLHYTNEQLDVYEKCLNSNKGEEYSTFFKNCSQVQGDCLSKASNNWELRANTPKMLKRNLLNGNYGNIKTIISYPIHK